MPNPIELKTPDADLIYEFDWTEQLASGVTVVSVAHSVPDPLILIKELTDTEAGQSLVEIAGGLHGGIYVITALATLSTQEKVPAQFTLRVLEQVTA